ncbi:MAG: hypothetical protein ACK5C4_00035 [Pseudanabaena sp.]
MFNKVTRVEPALDLYVIAVPKTKANCGALRRNSPLFFVFYSALSPSVPTFLCLAERNLLYEPYFSVSSADGAGNTKIGFLKAHRWRAFKKPIFINENR